MDDQSLNQQINSSTAPKKWYRSWRIIYPILGLVLAVEVVLGLKTLFTPLPKFKVQSLQPISGAKLVLLTPKNTYQVGENIPITVRVSTSGYYTSGTDLVLKYDPKILEASPSSVTSGRIYDDYPLINVDNKNGTIRVSAVSAINNQKKGFNGVGQLAIVNFKAKNKGVANLTVDFQPDLTSESNVIDADSSKDVLEKGFELKVTIQ